MGGESENATLRYEGIETRLGGKTFIIPALSLGWIKRNENLIAGLRAVPIDRALSKEQIETVLTVIHAAVARNYPHVTVEELEELVDLRNMKPVIEAVMGVSGLVPQGET